MTDKELMQMALDALINAKGYIFHNVLDDKANQYDTAVEALRARLAQPEPEPVAWFIEGTFMDGTPSFIQVCETDPEFYTPLYRAPQPEPEPVADKYLMEVECTKCGAKQDGILTVNAPPQREWQGLTDDEILEEYRQSYGDDGDLTDVYFARAIEAKLKAKNHD